MSRALAVCTILAFLIGLAACGGGGNRDNNQPRPPLITSTPPASANEGDAYSYSLTALDPNAGATVTFELTAAPAGAALNGTTLTWTPSAAQARKANSFVVTARTSPTLATTQNWSVTPTGVIRGTALDTFHSLEAPAVLPYDMSQSDIFVLVPNADGSATTLPGVGNTDGTFSIAHVPGGYVWLAIDGYLYWTDSSTFDYGADFLGRADAAYGTTTLDVDLTGLASWKSGDHVEWIAPNVNGAYQLVANLPDATTGWKGLVTFTQPSALPDAARSDHSWVYQVHEAPAFGGGLSLTRLEKSLGPLSLTIPVDATTALAGAMRDVTLDQAFRFKVTGTEFATMFSQVQPNATLWELLAFLELQSVDAGGPNLSNGGNAPLLASLYGGEAANGGIGTDVDYGDVYYGSPFPAQYVPVFTYSQTMSVGYQLSGTNNPHWEDGYLGHQTITLPTVNDGVRPLLSPAQNPRIDDRNFFTDATLNTLTPTITWSVPSVNRTGAPISYDVGIFRLFKNASGDTDYECVGRLLTMTTSVRVPAGILQRSNSYFFWIFAIADPRTDNSKSPERMGFPDAWSEALSATFTTSSSASGAQPALGLPLSAAASKTTAKRAARRPMPKDLIRSRVQRQRAW